LFLSSIQWAQAAATSVFAPRVELFAFAAAFVAFANFVVEPVTNNMTLRDHTLHSAK
jgi:hypothetical protein